VKGPKGVAGVMAECLGDVGGAGEAVQADHESAPGGHDLWGGTGSDAGQVLTKGRFLCSNEAYQFMQVTALVDPTLRHKNRSAVLVDGPEIIVRSVRTRQA
jgi:hypothetical protein